MRIDEAIAKLQQIRDAHGNLELLTPGFDESDPEDVEIEVVQTTKGYAASEREAQVAEGKFVLVDFLLPRRYTKV